MTSYCAKREISIHGNDPEAFVMKMDRGNSHIDAVNQTPAII